MRNIICILALVLFFSVSGEYNNVSAESNSVGSCVVSFLQGYAADITYEEGQCPSLCNNMIVSDSRISTAPKQLRDIVLASCIYGCRLENNRLKSKYAIRAVELNDCLSD